MNIKPGLRPRNDTRSCTLPITISSPSPSIQVFLSSTIRDLKDLREDLAKRLAKFQIRCFRSEEDCGGHQTVVDYCRWHLNDSDGYILLLGLWYGWIPPTCDRSITQLEYEWALDKWQASGNAPLLVLNPTAGAPLWIDLQKRAQALATEALDNDPGWDAAGHDSKLTAFRKKVTNGRVVAPVETESDLRDAAIAYGNMWKGMTPQAAACGVIQVTRTGTRIEDVQLGSLGREPHARALKKAINQLRLFPRAPALACLAYGSDQAGQKALAAWLLGHPDKILSGRPTTLVRPPVDNFTAENLTIAIAQSLGFSARTPVDLAALAAARLAEQPLHFLLDHVNHIGVVAFQEQFWIPFYRAVLDHHGAKPLAHRLSAVVFSYKASEGDPSPAVTGAIRSAADYERLLLLPKLEDLSLSDVIDWLAAMDVPDDPPGYSLQLAQRVLMDADGNPDPTPLHVYDRLRGEDLKLGARA
jgi:hypothetical protein